MSPYIKLALDLWAKILFLTCSPFLSVYASPADWVLLGDTRKMAVPHSHFQGA